MAREKHPVEPALDGQEPGNDLVHEGFAPGMIQRQAGHLPEFEMQMLDPPVDMVDIASQRLLAGSQGFAGRAPLAAGQEGEDRSGEAADEERG